MPPMWCAKSQLKSAVRAPPMWRKPVGDGAKRTRTAELMLVHPVRKWRSSQIWRAVNALPHPAIPIRRSTERDPTVGNPRVLSGSSREVHIRLRLSAGSPSPSVRFGMNRGYSRKILPARRRTCRSRARLILAGAPPASSPRTFSTTSKPGSDMFTLRQPLPDHAALQRRWELAKLRHLQFLTFR